MTAVFHARPYGGFIEIRRNLRRKKLHTTNQGFKFLGNNNRKSVRVPVQFGRERQTQHLKNYFSSTDSFILISTPPELLNP